MQSARTIILVAFILLNIISNAQISHPYVKKMNATAVNGRLFITWTTHAGFTCQDIHIELSTDSNNFERKGTYFGLCGDTSEKDYSYIIEDPYLNTTNYIRLELGNFGYSFIISEVVIYVKNEILILPHPVTNESQMLFSNPLKEEIKATFYNIQGELLHQTITTRNNIPLNNIPYQNGLVIYQLQGENSFQYTGKLFFE